MPSDSLWATPDQLSEVRIAIRETVAPGGTYSVTTTTETRRGTVQETVTLLGPAHELILLPTAVAKVVDAFLWATDVQSVHRVAKNLRNDVSLF